MGLFGDVFGSGSEQSTESTRRVTLPLQFPAETELYKQQLALARRQISELGRLGTLNDQVLDRFLPMYNQQGRFENRTTTMTGQALSAMSPIINSQDDLFRMEMNAIRRGVQLTPDQAALIRSSADNAIDSGLSDISRFRDESLRSLAQETSVARGLRPEDTPILDVGGRIANESSRQAAQLISGVRGQEAEMRLRYPIEAGQFIAGRTQAQQQNAQTSQAFLSQLRNDAFNNRLNLIATTGTLAGNNAQFTFNPATLSGLQQLRLGSATVNQKGNVSQENTPSLFGAITSGFGALGGGLAPIPGG